MRRKKTKHLTIMPTTHFRSRARVIDLLGRQQIADTPTAIGELMKNALDAGARNFWADYRAGQDLLIMRDDGVGMRESDVLDKWLVLATESKYISRAQDGAWLQYADETQKIWCAKESYGEKGIGRLSSAAMGSGLLLWTVWGDEAHRQGTLCIINWELFKLPSKLFDDLPIVYRTFNEKPTKSAVLSLFEENHQQTKDCINDVLNQELAQRICNVSDSILKMGCGIESLPWEMGTSFYVTSLNQSVGDLFNDERPEPDSYASSDRIKAYHTFSSFWNPYQQNNNHRTFCIHPMINGVEFKHEIERFWTAKDFTCADHHISIDINEDGYAFGVLKDYGSAPKPYRVQLKKLPQGMISPGRMHVEIGYVQGDVNVTKLPKELHRNLNARLELAGGFSVYMNNVRVQPYGIVENDFLGFEARRSLNAGRYYFSNRRMFGGLFIDSKKATKLREKAGREGFINNAAYKGLKYWLQDLFLDLADSQYGSKAHRSDKEVRKKSNSKSKSQTFWEEKKKAFVRKVIEARSRLPEILNETKKKVRVSRGVLSKAQDRPSREGLEGCRQALLSLQEVMHCLISLPDALPPGICLDGDELEAFQNYQTSRNTQIQNLERELCNYSAALQKVASEVEDSKLQIEKLENEEKIMWKSIRQSITESIQPVYAAAGALRKQIDDFSTAVFIGCENEYKQIIGDLDLSSIVYDKSGECRKRWEYARLAVYKYLSDVVSPKIEKLSEDVSYAAHEQSSAFLLSEMAQNIQNLKEENSFLTEMAQVGLIVETADHEFNSHVDEVRDGLDALARIIPNDEKNLLERISKSFNIIEERVSLYDPLLRRRGKERVSISGTEIERFIIARMSSRLDGICLECSNSFRSHVWNNVKWPVFMGAIFNIIDNAIYWSKQTLNEPHILLAVNAESLVISDSGPGVSEVDAARIFIPGFSRKPYGRGLGLYIAKEALNRLMYDLSYAPSSDLGALQGAVFVISPRK